MAKPNYAFEKRQRELAKKRKKEEKASRKASPTPEGAEADPSLAGEQEGGVPPAPPPAAGEPGKP